MPLLRDLTEDERAAYFRGVQPIWGGGLDEARFVAFQRRLADSLEAADRYRLLGWFEAEGSFVSAMKAYDLEGTCAGRALRLLGIGAVFTPPGLRRRGHAAAMLQAAMRDYAARGCHVAVLFSDIDAGFYERLGFRALESRECIVEAAELPRPSGGFRAAAPGDEERLSAILACSRKAGRLSLSRDGWTLRLQLRRLRELARARGVGEPEWGIIVSGRGGEAAAVVRLGRDTVDLLDAGWTTEAARDRLLGGLRDCLNRSARSKLRLWPAHQLRGMFAPIQREAAIAMVAPLSGETRLPEPGELAELALLDHI
jgi:predicted N-acetyltransferase YhbS